MHATYEILDQLHFNWGLEIEYAHNLIIAHGTLARR